MSLEVPDYSPIFAKYEKELETSIINYVKGTLKLKYQHDAFLVNHTRPITSIERFFIGNGLEEILPEMVNERRKLEDEIVGDDEDEAYDSGFWGECDEEWDGYVSHIIYMMIEEKKIGDGKW